MAPKTKEGPPLGGLRHLFLEDTAPGSLTFRPMEKCHPKRKVVFSQPFFRGYVTLDTIQDLDEQ